MRYLIIILGFGLLSAALFATFDEADASMAARLMNRSVTENSPIENVGYYYRRH